ncbi:MAG: FAD/NAD(P)-binding protein [Flavobacteriales bacterium]|jgi:uncharacterized NAD(P)/FAD-binding protein YdhS|nr:FAD/NAD(P)-binding protein [Flavobacteriales bacterium]
MASPRSDGPGPVLHVAVVGGGLSGTLMAMRLLMRAGRDVRITLVERMPQRLNRGVAYSAKLPRQLLNVPAGHMSLFPERPDDLLQWAHAGAMPGLAPEAFMPRDRYGDHVAQRWAEQLKEHPGQVDVVHAAAIALERLPGDGHRITLDDGRTVHAHATVLAMGNAPPGDVPGLDPTARAHPGHVPWPWKEGALEAIGRDDAVFFAGAGLTMADLLLSLDASGHIGPVTVVSRGGRLPLPHAQRVPCTPHQPLPQPPFTVAALMAWLRREAAMAARRGLPWQAVMDHVKQYVPQWWQGMDLAERARFMRHARPLWEVHRHRMPLPVRERLLALVRSGRVRLMAGRIIGVRAAGRDLHVEVRARGTGACTTVAVRHLLNCTGPQADTRRLDQPLVTRLMEQGLAVWDPLHLGLATTAEGALVHADGRAADDLFAMGPLCKATLWESTAVPEIREQARDLAERIVAGWQRR